MLRDFANGFSFAWSGLSVLNTRGLRRFVAIPLVVNVLVFAVVITVGLRQFETLLGRLLGYLPGWLDWLQWLLWPLLVLVILLVSIYTFTLLANLLAAPFNGLLSEKYELMLTGQQVEVQGRSFISELLRSPVHELSKLAYMVRWLIPLALLFLVPGLNVVAPALWLVFGGWLLALEYLDYPMDNHAIGVRKQRERLAGRRWLAMGFGAGVMLMTTIPVLNLVAMPAGVLGATRLWCQELRPVAREDG